MTATATPRHAPPDFIPPEHHARRRFEPDTSFWRERAAGASYRALARRYGVHHSVIARLLRPIEAEIRTEREA